ncbi:MAG TPA: hypothetical protein VG245_05775 [Candidatus Dormibacteraeota bacterium]|jgi:hypothetical protein|nr:hypothetical protein [Candidatus Dormibacteraeota bacterium]
MSGSRLRPPDDPRLRALAERLRDDLALIDPLGAYLRGGGEARAGLPRGGVDAEDDGRDRLETARRGLAAIDAEGLGPDDALDRLALGAGVGRAGAGGAIRRAPGGAIMVERHLLAVLTRLEWEPGTAGEALAEMAESAPRFLAEARESCLGCPAPAAQVALAAAQRLPQILDLAAAGAAATRVPGALRQRIEAALGALLMAAAEDAGWLVREVLPSAGRPPVPLNPEAEVAAEALGMSLAEVEAAAEAALAERALAADAGGLRGDAGGPGEPSPTGGGAVPPGGGVPPPPGRPGATHSLGAALVSLTPELVERAWRQVAERGGRFCAPPPAGIAIEPAPAWLGPLLPPLALVPAPVESDGPARLLVGDAPPLSPADLEGMVAAVYLQDFLPAAWQRAEPRLARLLLPAADLGEGWRLHAHAAAPLARWRPEERGREVAWRALLALIAAGMLRGRMDVATGADLIERETAMAAETALAQATHVAAAPMAALRWIAGRRLVEAALSGPGSTGDPAQARAALLRRGPLPGAAISLLSA